MADSFFKAIADFFISIADFFILATEALSTAALNLGFLSSLPAADAAF
jgi:hypothetical protein